MWTFSNVYLVKGIHAIHKAMKTKTNVAVLAKCLGAPVPNWTTWVRVSCELCDFERGMEPDWTSVSSFAKWGSNNIWSVVAVKIKWDNTFIALRTVPGTWWAFSKC